MRNTKKCYNTKWFDHFMTWCIRCATKFPLFVNRWLEQKVLVDFDIFKTSWTKLRHMVNQPFWHIRDFVLGSYTFGCVKMSDFVPNNRHLREVLIFFFHSKKTTAQAHREFQKVYGDATLSETTCRDSFRRFKDGDFDAEKPSKTLNWRHCSMRIRAKRKKNLLQH